jgi:DNA-directed RNA polymerase subunit RPC12/RpoP
MICKICGKQFETTEGEIQFYKDRSLEPPKRCPECRAKKRREVKENGTIQGYTPANLA